MAKGIIYIMETVVPGLIKIGKTASDNLNSVCTIWNIMDIIMWLD